MYFNVKLPTLGRVGVHSETDFTLLPQRLMYKVETDIKLIFINSFIRFVILCRPTALYFYHTEIYLIFTSERFYLSFSKSFHVVQ